MTRRRVRLSDEDMEWARELMRARRSRTDNPRAREYGKDPDAADLQGLMGEIATARFYGASTDPIAGPVDSGIDLELHGFTLQIKSSAYFGYPATLMAKPNEHFKADAFLLALVDTEDPVVELAGWALTSELLAGHFGRAFRGAKWDNYYLSEDELRECRPPGDHELQEPEANPERKAEEETVEYWLEAWKDLDVEELARM
jgi:hypothetical protein